MIQHKIIFSNSSGKEDYKKLDIVFVNQLNRFLKEINCVEIQINSSFRPTGASHRFGRAIDIDHITTKKKKYLFDFRYGKEYSSSLDQEFFYICKSKLKENLFQYYSPSIIKNPNVEHRDNIFRNSKNKFSEWEKNNSIMATNKKNNLPDKRTLDQQHINHLHLAIDSEDKKLQKNYFGNSILTKKNVVVASGGLFSILFLGSIGYYFYNKNKSERKLLNA